MPYPILRIACGSIVILSMLAAAAPAAEKPAPATRPYTYHEFARDVVAFNRETFIEPYKKLGKRDPKWDANALAYLEEIVQQVSVDAVPKFYRPDDSLALRPHALASGKALIDAGCDDPVVLYCHAANLIDTQKALEGRPLLKKAVEGLRAAKYPPYLRAIAEDRMVNQTPDPDEKKAAREIGAEAWINAFCGEHSSAYRRRVVDARWLKLTDRAKQKAFLEAIAARKDADRWMKGVYTGYLEIKLAWDDRGNGLAYTVTEQGWRGFYKHLTLARDAFKDAYAAAPNLPEAPTGMITIAMGAGEMLREKPLDWFDFATKAQLDYEPAYHSMLGGPLLPRWGGSMEEMLQLADACVAYLRFDTILPMFYLETIERIGIDTNQPWFLLSRPEVYDQIVKVTEGYAAALGKKKGAYYKSLHLAVARRMNKLAEARKVLDEMSAASMTPDPKAYAYFDVPNGPDTLGSIYAHTGKHAEKLAQAEEQAKVGDSAAAKATMTAILAEAEKTDPAYGYYTQRLFQIEQQARFNAGDWSSMQVKDSLSGWSKRTGFWSVDPAGAITGHCDPHNAISVWSFLEWLGKENGRDPGRSFEISGVLTFPEEPDLKYVDAAVEIATRNDKGPAAMVVDFNRKASRVDIFVATERVLVPAKYQSGSRFSIRVADRKLSVQIDDKTIKDQYPLPEGWDGDLKIAIGVCGPNVSKFQDLKIRKARPIGEQPKI